MGDLVAFGEAEIQNSRSDALMDKERPKLDLLPRTVPLELPPHDQEAAAQLSLDEDLRKRRIRLEEKRKREREAEQKKKKSWKTPLRVTTKMTIRKELGLWTETMNGVMFKRLSTPEAMRRSKVYSKGKVNSARK